jgi:hypothetical protein
MVSIIAQSAPSLNRAVNHARHVSVFSLMLINAFSAELVRLDETPCPFALATDRRRAMKVQIALSSAALDVPEQR